MENILVVDDDIEIHSQLRLSLGGSNLIFATTLAEARQLSKINSLDLIILDVSLPDGDGFQFLMELQSEHQFLETPVVFLTSRRDSHDKVAGLSLGADDYVTKPFDRMELKARVQLRINKIKKEKSDKHFLQKKDLCFDLSMGQVRIDKGTEKVPVDLTAFEFKLLLYFAEHEGQVLSRQHLLDVIWGSDKNVVDRTIDAHVSNLRKKITSSSYCLRSVYGVGYQMAGADLISRKRAF